MRRMRPLIERLQVEGHAHLDQGRLSLSESGRLLVDSIAVGLMESLEK